MKASELIRRLEQLVKSAGDLEVQVTEPGPSSVYPLEGEAEVRVVNLGRGKKEIWIGPE